MTDHYAKVQEVNEILKAGEPENISEDPYSGYTGYTPQAVKNAMNKVFGIGQWGFSEISNELTNDDSGKPIVIAKVEVWLVGVDWHPQAWGQAKILRGEVGDARKSAETDALKKALSNFSIGDRAYLGLLPGKKKQAENARNENQNGRRPAGASSANASTNRGDQGGQRPRTFTKVDDQGQRPATASAPAPASQPAPETDDQSQPTESAPAPNAAKLFKKIDDLKIKRDGKILTRQQVLAWAFKDEIKASKGQLTVDLLVKAGDQLGADYCEVLAAFIKKIEDNRKAA